MVANDPSYIVDWEIVDDYRNQPDHKLVFSDDEFVYWCLAKVDYDNGDMLIL
jgi:hypothetical protein